MLDLIFNGLNVLKSAVWGTPTLAVVVITAVAATIALRFLQFTEFFKSWGKLFEKEEGKAGELTPFQAFLNTLNSSLGNGVMVGVAMAIGIGGPGAVFWMFVLGFFLMIIRFIEVYLSMSFTALPGQKSMLGGPFQYLGKIPFGFFWPTFYAISCLIYVFIGGGMMQANSIANSFASIISLPTWVFGAIVTVFALYIVFGGAQRIIKMTSILVPVKVGLFLFFCLGVLIINYENIIPAILLIVKSAFNPSALGGTFAGITAQLAFRESLIQMFGASEAGVGTAGILYGSTGSKRPFYNGLTAMIGTFITVNIAACLIGLCIVASGAWQSGAVGAALTSHAFSSAFGVFGGLGSALLTILFGTGVFIAYGLIGRLCWIYLIGDRALWLFNIIFCTCAFLGSVINVSAVWALLAIVSFFCVASNFLGIIFLLPYVRNEVLPVLKESGK